MTPILIIVAVSLSALFITLGTGANAAFTTPKNSSAIAMKFAFFMSVSYFCFYYIGVWISKFLLGTMTGEMLVLTSAALFFTVAVKTVWNVFSYKVEDNAYNLSKTAIQLLLSVAGGFNALLLSIGLTLFQATMFANIPALVLKTALIVTLGAFTGTMSGAKLSVETAKKVTKPRPDIIGTAVMLVLAVYL
jgi:putative Mn2+ efflux pump MntP